MDAFSIILILVITSLGISSAENVEYISKNSETGDVRRWEGDEEQASGRVRRAANGGGLTNAEIKMIVDAHNARRTVVSPAAKDMKRLVWDDELATLAQDYACRCSYDHSTSAYRTTDTYPSIGENLFFKTGGWNVESTATSAVNSWYNEETDYTYTTRACSAVCGHYTQGAWANTEVIGCGYASCTSLQGLPSWDNRNPKTLVCHYGPAGNYQGASPYTTGNSCSNCPAGFTDGCSDALCGPTTNCQGKTCQNGGVLSSDGSCVCTCPDGYYGAYCSSAVDPTTACTSGDGGNGGDNGGNNGSDTPRPAAVFTCLLLSTTGFLLLQ